MTKPVNDSAQLLGTLGNVKKFVFALANPILKSLSRNHNRRVFEGFANNILPQTGLQSHARGNLVKQQVEQGNYQQAIDILKKHRVQVDYDKLWKEPWCNDATNYETCIRLGPCRLIVPSIDRLLTERLQSQTTIATSLMQSLYVDIKAHVRTELDAAEEQLNKLGAEADMLGEKLSELMVEHFWERIIIFLVCGGTLIICI